MARKKRKNKCLSYAMPNLIKLNCELHTVHTYDIALKNEREKKKQKSE